MTLKTWSFSKKKNSTAQPSGSGDLYNVRLKEDTSIEKPTFIIGTGIDADINYCQFAGNYYFIDDIEVLTNDQVALHCSIDVLATHKSAIGSYRAFVKRSSYENDPNLIDNCVSTESAIVSETIATTDLFGADQSGCFIVRCVSPAANSPTGIASYVLDMADMESLLYFITSENNFAELFDDVVTKAFFNPFQYILSIMWIPKSKSDIPGTNATLKIGWWTPGTFKKMTTHGYYDNVTVNKPTSYYTGGYKQAYKAFTILKAYIPGMGVVEMDPICLSKNLSAEVSIDYTTGQMDVGFYARGSQGGLDVNLDSFGSFSVQLGIPIQCGQLSSMMTAESALSYSGIIGNIKDQVFNALQIMGTPITAITRAAGGDQTVFGSTGNRSMLVAHPRLILYQRAYGSGESPNAWYGSPLCKSRLISAVPGFVLCECASIDLAAPDTEVEAVNNYLNTGFYYE